MDKGNVKLLIFAVEVSKWGENLIMWYKFTFAVSVALNLSNSFYTKQ